MSIKKNITSSRIVTPERILKQLRIDIITGKYAMSDKIIETELAEKFNASRGSVRVALQTLEGEGLIQSLPNGRKEVLGLSLKQVDDMYDLRLLIEKRAVERILQERSSLFSPILEAMRQIEKSMNINDQNIDWFDLDIQFHQALVASANNIPLLKAWEVSSPIMYALLALNTSCDYKERYIREFYDKHRKILELIITENPDCFDVLKEHINDAKDISTSLLISL